MSLKAWIEPNTTGAPAGTVFRIRYRDRSGLRHTAENAGTDKANAKKLLKIVQNRLDLGRLGLCDTSRSVQEVYELYLRECRNGLANIQGKIVKESTLATKGFQIAPLLKLVRTMNELDASLISRWKADLMAQVEHGEIAPWTAYGRLKDARTFLLWCKRKKHITWNPFEGIGLAMPNSKPRYYTDEELAALEKEAADPRIRLALRWGYQGGMRNGEVLRASMEDVRWLPDGSGELRIWGTDSKNGENRTIPLSPKIMALITEVVGSRRTGQILEGWNKEKFSYYWAKLKYAAGIIDAGVKFKKYGWAKDKAQTEEDPARFHDLRHTFCKLYLENGGSVAALRQLTGHKSIDILIKTYSHFEARHLHAGVMAIENRVQRLETIKPELVGSDGEIRSSDCGSILGLAHAQAGNSGSV